MAHIVIIGAGLTGLSAAYHLEKRGFFDFEIFEKESEVGGLCRSVKQDGFTFDFTGHLLHTADSYFRQFIETVVGLEHLNVINRRSYIYSHNTYTKYPFQINLFGLPTPVIVECIESFVSRSKKKNAKSFYSWVLANFGQGIARHFFFPFQRKIFDYELKQISATWMGRFVPNTSLQQMITGAIADSTDSSIGYNAQFFYPKEGGIQSWIDKLHATIEKPIRTEYSVDRIDLRNKVITFSNGHEERFNLLVNTMPLDQLLNKLVEKPNTTLKKSAKQLVCNSVINFNLGINKHNLTEKHWIYFPEEQYPFYRVGFPHNFANSMVPAGCSSLYGECAFIKRSADQQNELVKQALATTKTLFNIDKQSIMTEKIITISHGYVIFNFWREKNLPTLLKQLEEQNIYSVGRYGAWKYSSMQEAVLDGKKIAETITVLPATKTCDNSYIGQHPKIQKETEYS